MPTLGGALPSRRAGCFILRGATEAVLEGQARHVLVYRTVKMMDGGMLSLGGMQGLAPTAEVRSRDVSC